jgi:hypothetical protein
MLHHGLMQSYNLLMITNLYRACKRSNLTDATLQSISRDGYSQTNRRSDLTDAAMLADELTEIYSTPTPKGLIKRAANRLNNIKLQELLRPC